MATHIEHEMTSCLNEMERLQAKMMELQETKKKQESEQENKTNNTEPNMAVMDNWLHIAKYNEEQKVLSKAAEKKYNDYLARGREQRRNFRENPLSDEEEEERKTIMGDYSKYYTTNNLKTMKMFHIQKYKAPDTPSQFMIDYIEATHNLFKIQQKRIDELESVVAELNSKIGE